MRCELGFNLLKGKRLDEDVEVQAGRMSRVGTAGIVSGTVILVPPQN
ncbi:hypothetical protein PC120_g19380 [Phytophthora cactorum]|nr:hypothetical protein PC120_g19380 [Phytophthora cactorum]